MTEIDLSAEALKTIQALNNADLTFERLGLPHVAVHLQYDA